jgi:2-polyprenyl-3-methyl-5-hydroxy-6-metoxy-1,4-benzoquinol methylase
MGGRILKDRKAILEKYCRGKSVLDIGCAGGIGDDKDKLTHEIIRSVASHVLGVDNNKKAVEMFKKRGYDIIHADAASLSIGRKFDVVFAGEIIEHIEDQGIFLENVKKHLRPEGVLILSTPNAQDFAYHLNRFMGRMENDYKKCRNIGHVVAHSYGTIRHLLEKAGFRIIDHYYINSICLTKRRKAMRPLTHIFPDMAESILVVARLGKP